MSFVRVPRRDEIIAVIEKMQEVRHLLDHSMHKTMEFTVWHEYRASAEDIQVMREVTEELSWYLFVGAIPANSLCSDLNNTSLTQAIIASRKELSRLRTELHDLLSNESMTNSLGELKSALETRMLRLHNVFLSFDIVTQDAVIVREAENKITEEFVGILDQLNLIANSKPSLYQKIKEKIVAIDAIISKLNQLRDVQMLREWREMVGELMHNTPVDLAEFLFDEKPQLLRCVADMVAKLAPVSAKYQRHLQGSANTNIDTVACVNGGVAPALPFFSLIHWQQQNHEMASKHLAQGNYAFALKCFLAGARQFYVRSMVSAGQMMLAGKGCQANPIYALKFFRAALCCTENVGVMNDILRRVGCAYAEYVKNGAREPSEDEISLDEQKMLEIFSRCNKKIQQMVPGLAVGKYFHLGRFHLALYAAKLRANLPDSSDEDDQAFSHVRDACKDFKSALMLASAELNNALIRLAKEFGDGAPSLINVEKFERYQNLLVPTQKWEELYENLCTNVARELFSWWPQMNTSDREYVVKLSDRFSLHLQSVNRLLA